jgi:hypothetical protein
VKGICDQDSVIGVVTYQDLVRVLARADDQIAADVRRRLATYTTPGRFATDVRDGAVVLTDRAHDPGSRRADTRNGACPGGRRRPGR